MDGGRGDGTEGSCGRWTGFDGWSGVFDGSAGGVSLVEGFWGGNVISSLGGMAGACDGSGSVGGRK